MVSEDGPRPAKVGHRKSRNGCIKCKSRRVKCDEVRPRCGNCSRLQLTCSWPDIRENLLGGQNVARSSTEVDSGRTTRSNDDRGVLRSTSNSPQVPLPIPAPAPAPTQHTHLSPPITNTSISPGPSSTSTSGPGLYESPPASSYWTNWPRWPNENDPFSNVVDDSQGSTLPESRARRLLEHRLLLNYYTRFTPSFDVHPAESWRKVWTQDIPRMGLTYDNVMCALLATSATNLLRVYPNDKELYNARQGYFISALQEQRREVAKLSADNAQGVCFGALLISICTFAMLKDRGLEPYEPPMEWLQIGRGAGTVIWQSVQTIADQGRESENTALMTIASSYPYFGRDQSYFSPAMRARFAGVLTQAIQPCNDDWTDPSTREAYEKALSYVGSIQKGLNDGEPLYAVTRRIQTFALLVPPRFIEFLGAQRPRALVIMAHFWACVSQVKGVWWVGTDDDGGETTAKREIRAIKGVVPREWMGTMVWPLDRVGLRDVEDSSTG